MMTMRIGSQTLDAVRDRAVWFEVDEAPMVRIVGPDARRFCNGMFTNNVRDLPVGGHNRSAMIDDRGRIGGFLDLCCLDEVVFLAVIDGVDVAAFLGRYEKYVVFDEVTLEVVTGWARWTVQGAAAQGIFSVGAGRYHRLEPEGLVYAHARAPHGGYDVLVPPGAGPTIAEVLDRVALRISSAEGEGLRVLGGRPRFPQDTGDKRLVAEIGLRDELLSFEKGCYIGQETVNRVDVMGQVKRQLAGVRVIGGADVPLGAEVLLEEVVGELTSAVVLPNGDLVALAVLKKPADTPGTVVTVRAGPERSWPAVIEILPFAP